MLHEKLNDISSLFLEGLIIRTLPNSKQKLSQNYMQITPPFFTIEAMQYIRDIGVKHLLVDVPSVDRLFDDGHLSCHNIFWNTKEKKYNSSTKNYTITEMISGSGGGQSHFAVAGGANPNAFSESSNYITEILKKG